MMVNNKSSIRKKSQGDYQKEYVSSAKRGLIEKLFLALAVLMLCACSSDDELESSFNGANATGSVAYLTVNLREVGSTTRASNGGYAYGSGTEQTIANAYFYFYNADGSAAAKGSITSGVNGTPTAEPVDPATYGDIEWDSETVVAVWGIDDQWFPTQMLTILNKPTDIDLTGLSLTDATKVLAGTPYADANANGNFVMSTSTYYSNGIVNTTALTEANFAPEPIDLTTDYPNGGVDVYVERLAAKVGLDMSDTFTANDDGTYDVTVTDDMLGEFQNAPTAPTGNTYVIRLHGWNVDGVARDAYIVKDITPFATSWTNAPGFTGWNVATDYRCYWAASPAYGDTEVTYPKSSHGNTATQEASESTWLNKYLRYTDLAQPVALGSTTYCGENTNTAAVINANDSSINCLTNVLLKAQFGYEDENDGFTGVDIVRYNGYLYTVADFCQECVGAVKFVDIIDDAIDALPESEYSESDLTALKTAAANGSVVYSTDATPSTVSELTAFGGEMLSLYNAYDGNVTIGYNMDSSTIDNNIVYSGLDLDGYNFWFSVNTSELEETTITTLTTASLLVLIEGNYYIPLTEQNTMRSYFLSALAADAAITNSGFGASYPNYFKDGLMYYHVPIEHLGTAPSTGINEGQYGVVRNHWYDISITSISSFGRGIAKEDEVIVPIGDNGIQTNSIGASTKIYSWKEYDQMVIF